MPHIGGVMARVSTRRYRAARRTQLNNETPAGSLTPDELALFTSLFEQYQTDGKVDSEGVRKLMRGLNDDIEPPQEDFEYVSAETGDSGFEDVKHAITMWYRTTYAHHRELEKAQPSRRVQQAVYNTVHDGSTKAGVLESSDRENVSEVFRKYSHGKPRVGKEQLQRMMTDLNEGKAPTAGEVDLVMSVADVSKTGDLDETEFVHAVTVWYLELEEVAKKEAESNKSQSSQGCCVVL
eukprot:PhM_4_TR16738/c0_g1_i1/m.30396